MLPNHLKLIVLKLLALSNSPNEHEALAAIRRANAILNDWGVTWEQMLTPPAVGDVTITVVRPDHTGWDETKGFRRR